MKKIIFLLLPILVLLGGCSQASEKVTDLESIQARIAQSTELAKLQRADEDFVSSNFGSLDFVQSSAVYFSDRGDEIGLFLLQNAKRESEMRSRIEQYLESERAAVSSLAALYPADELKQRLVRFDRAEIGTVGTLVYYFLLDDPLREDANSIIGR